jgi:3-methyladenine DNA glycosylase AlkD
VKKAVNWALRGLGQHGPQLNAAAIEVAERLARSTDPTPRWIGKDALRALHSPTVVKRIAKRSAKARKG